MLCELLTDSALAPLTLTFVTALSQLGQSLLLGGRAVKAVRVQVGVILDTEHNFLATSHKEQRGRSIHRGELGAETKAKDRGKEETTEVFG